MAKYDEVIANLSQVDDDTLNSTHGEAKARIAELRPKIADRSLSNDELTELAGLKDAFTQLNTEVTARSDRREAAYGAADELASLVEEPEEEPVSEEQVEEQTETEQAPAEEAQVEEPELVAASAAPKAPKTPKLGDVAKAAPKAPEGQSSIAITAAADVHGFYAGQTLEKDQLGKAMASRLRALSASSATDGEPMPVASLTASGIPEDRILKANDSIERNTNKIAKVTSTQAITAAGGLCAPLAIDYNYGVWGIQGRPIKNALPSFQVERGGIQFRRDLSPMVTVTDAADATGFWSMTQGDANSDEALAEAPGGTAPNYDDTAYAGPVKQLWVVPCPDTETAQVEAITFQVEFANITSRFDPETLQANTEAALIWHDRVCENHLLGQLQAASKYMTSGQVLGATRDLLVTFDKTQAYYRSVHRLGDNVRLRAILPFWAKALIRSDLARQFNDDSFATLNVSDAQINSFFESRNITPVWHLDGSATDVTTAGTSGSAGFVPAIDQQQYAYQAQPGSVPNYPAQVDMLLHPEGHFQHLDGGTLDLGIVRDAQLVRRNRYRMFSESFEGVAARGVEALRLVATVLPTGGMSGTVSPGTGPVGA